MKLKNTSNLVDALTQIYVGTRKFLKPFEIKSKVKKSLLLIILDEVVCIWCDKNWKIRSIVEDKNQCLTFPCNLFLASRMTLPPGYKVSIFSLEFPFLIPKWFNNISFIFLSEVFFTFANESSIGQNIVTFLRRSTNLWMSFSSPVSSSVSRNEEQPIFATFFRRVDCGALRPRK